MAGQGAAPADATSVDSEARRTTSKARAALTACRRTFAVRSCVDDADHASFMCRPLCLLVGCVDPLCVSGTRDSSHRVGRSEIRITGRCRGPRSDLVASATQSCRRAKLAPSGHVTLSGLDGHQPAVRTASAKPRRPSRDPTDVESSYGRGSGTRRSSSSRRCGPFCLGSTCGRSSAVREMYPLPTFLHPARRSATIAERCSR